MAQPPLLCQGGDWPVRNISWFNNLCNPRNPRLERPVIRELQFQPEVRRPQQLNHFLQQIPALSTHTHQITLNGCLHLDFAVFDFLYDLFGLLDWNTGLDGNFLTRRGTSRGSNWAISEVLKRHFAFGQLLLKNL